MEILKIKTNKREEIVDVTDKVEDMVKGVKDGLCILFVKHATAALIINENYDEAVCEDILDYLRRSIPKEGWKHNCIDGNADSHIKASILGPSELIVVKNGKLELGRWQGLGLVELDGPREREIIVKVI